METKNELWMKLALREAQKAFEQKEVPVGAVIVYKNSIIGKGFNQVEMLKDPTAHAEMIAISAAAAFLESKWLKDCTLYVTMEPCPMCAGAIILSRIPKLVFGCYDPKMGSTGTLYTITEDKRLNHSVHTIGGVMDDVSGNLLKEFFKGKRKV